jgi:hypothetical protein
LIFTHSFLTFILDSFTVSISFSVTPRFCPELDVHTFISYIHSGPIYFPLELSEDFPEPGPTEGSKGGHVESEELDE